MSRQEDFKRMAYDHDRESSPEKQQFYFDGAEDGYEYAVEKACEWLQCLEHELGYMCTGDFINSFRKAMEE